MTSPLDTKDWEFHVAAGFRPKVISVLVDCDRCDGKGKTGGGFKDLDGPIECRQCSGCGWVKRTPEREPMPEVPKELIDHMRNALYEWYEWYDKQQDKLHEQSLHNPNKI